MKIISSIFLFILIQFFGSAQCDLKNKPFKAGEFLQYNISYDWGIITLNAGEVSFEVKQEHLFGKSVYHFLGTGRTYENYDWFYKVRDQYESWADTTDLSPNVFYRNAEEGGKQYTNEYFFDRAVDSIYAKSIYGGKEYFDTLTYEQCLFDVLSLVYYCRTLDFNQYKINQKIPLTLILDGKKTEIFIRYLGKEIQEIEGVGDFNTIKFSALLVEGSIFSGGENMNIWITDDKNKFPVRVQAEILVGAINANIKSYEGLKFPMK